MQEKEKLKQKIVQALNKEGIIWFIVQEVEDSLDYLNKYKLQNIVDNLDLFVNDIKRLSNSYENVLAW